MLPEDVATAEVDVWPDNVPAKDVFIGMGTQWRAGPGGPTGLDYAALPLVMRALRIKRTEWADTLDALRVMEGVALDLIHVD